jgi:hypothetical protein
LGSVKILDNRIMASSDTAAAEHWSKSAKSTFVYRGNDYYSAKSDMNKFVGALVNLNGWKSKTGESDAEYKKSSFSDPSRDIENYASKAGGGSSFESFIAIARNMDKGSWKSAFAASAINSWMRGGFNMGGSSAASLAVASTPVFSSVKVSTGEVKSGLELL